MGVAGYEKVKTKVIEGKKKCIYKKPNGTKLYVKGFKKMRSIESYIKLCKKAAAKSAKPAKAGKKTRSKSTKKYGGFLQEFFANMEGEGFTDEKKKEHDKFSTMPMDSSAPKHSAPKHSASPASPATPSMLQPPATTGGKHRNKKHCNKKRGGNEMMKVMEDLTSTVQNSFAGGYRGGQEHYEQFQESQQDGGKRRKKYRAPKSMLDKLMMATLKKRSAKKGKKSRRKGGNILGNLNLMGGRCGQGDKSQSQSQSQY
jgi:hypothetical protein